MRTKEFLSVRGIEFESIDVQGDEAGLALLRSLGARTVPVVARGERWVSGQVLGQVAELVGIDADTGPSLSPGELVARLEAILSAAQRYIRQFTSDQLGRDVRDRKRSMRALGHHVFRIPEAFLECATEDVELAYDALVTPPGDDVVTGEDVARYGESVRERVAGWWRSRPDTEKALRTYYGPQTVHELLERTTWHSGQHVRQMMLILDEYGIEPDERLGEEAFEGLPMPESVWDG